MSSAIQLSSRKRYRFAFFAALALGTAAGGMLPQAHAQTAITGSENTVATVETVDTSEGEILLQGKDGSLITLEVPANTRDLPRLQPGDQVNLHFFQTLDASVAAPDTPIPQSTVSAARGYKNRHPHGTVISFRRGRVHVNSIDAAQHTVNVTAATGATRTVTVRQKAFFPLLNQLKPGDLVDLTTMEAVSFTVLNRVVAPNVNVQESTGSGTDTPAAAPAAPSRN